MAIDIEDTHAQTTLTPTGQSEIKIYRLGGNEVETNVKLYTPTAEVGNYLEISLSYYGSCWIMHLFTPKRTIYKGSQVVVLFKDNTLFKGAIRAGAFKYKQAWQSLCAVSHDDLKKLSEMHIKSISVLNEVRQTLVTYTYPIEDNEQYSEQHEGAELLRIACSRLLDEYNKVTTKPKPFLHPSTIPIHQTTDGRILTRQYNLNTKYGRRMARRQAEYNYEYGSEQYRNEIDNIKAVVWAIVLIVCLLVFILIWNVSGPEAALKWLR